MEDKDDFDVENENEVQKPTEEEPENVPSRFTSSPVVDASTASTSKGISFKSICPTPEFGTVTTSARQQHSIVFTNTPNKRNLKDSFAAKELKLKVQKLKGKIKNEKANIKK